ncbi:MAG TPA: hypothetical protein VLL75_21040 [Vicinamibacteria bacterium]|nr:hypothetical protein [Vicinamibacteria bacterium]
MKWTSWMAGIVLAAGGLLVGSAYSSRGPESATSTPTPLAPSSVQAGSTLVDCGAGQNVLLRQANGVAQVQCVPGSTTTGVPLSNGADVLQPLPVQAKVPQVHGAPVQARPVSYEPRTTRRVAPRVRTWKKSAAIIGGSTAAGAGVGAILDGGSGAKKGAVVGLVGGVVYDIATRNR